MGGHKMVLTTLLSTLSRPSTIAWCWALIRSTIKTAFPVRNKVVLTLGQALDPCSAAKPQQIFDLLDKPRGINHFGVFVRSKMKFAFHFTRSLDNKSGKAVFTLILSPQGSGTKTIQEFL
jgi:hypothetical protein